MTERVTVDFDLRRIGRHMPKQRYQRGSLRASVPATHGNPERKLPRGTWWAQWYQYVRQDDGKEKRRRREKIFDRLLAKRYGVELNYDGPLTKTDAQKTLDLLIAEEAGTYVRPDTEATFGALAREYLALSKPNWGPNMVRTAGNMILKHLAGGPLADAPISELTLVGLQGWINAYVEAGRSRSLLKGLVYHTRAILEHAIDKEIIKRNPARKLRAKSKRRVCERALSVEECRALLSAVTGRDHLVLGVLIQLGLRGEEVFALRRNDVIGDKLRIDEAIVEGVSAEVKTYASEDIVFIPPMLQVEITAWLEGLSEDPLTFLFTAPRGGIWGLQNYLNRIMKPTAVRARVGVYLKRTKAGKLVETSDVNFQSLRRTCATLFGGFAKDPKSTQAQLRHADPTMTLRTYQKSIPAEIKTASIAYEAALNSPSNRTGAEQVTNSTPEVVN